jgi:ubiquinone/menaquinone biosynthesis C-methylase UbiE
MERKSQAAEPRGIAGRVLGFLMFILNHRDNERAVKLLDLHSKDHVLEIGFGPGHLIKLLSQHVTEGRVAGVDVSQLMVASALKLNSGALASRRLELQRGSVSALPFPDASFDKVVAVHSFQFWPDPEGDLQEVKRVLRPGGSLVLVLRLSKRHWSNADVNAPAKASHQLRAVQDALASAGFVEVIVHGKKDVVARRPSVRALSGPIQAGSSRDAS